MQNSGFVDDDIYTFALDVFFQIDGRQSRYIKEVLDWYREEDARDLRRSELNEQVESMTCLNPPIEGENWKSENSWKSEKGNQNIVISEKFVKNIVMNEEFGKSTVMNAKIAPKVVMDLSISKLVDGTVCKPPFKIYWKNLLVRTNRGCLSNFQTEIYLFFVTQYLQRHSSSSDKHMKKLIDVTS